MSRHVKTKDPFILPGRPPIYSADGTTVIEPEVAHEVLNPGSVVMLDDDVARDFVKRGKGVFHPGPASKAPPPVREEREGPERPGDLGNKLARSERAVIPAGAR